MSEKLTNIEVATILSAKTLKGMVTLKVNGEEAQLDLNKAREVHRNLGGAIEAAISDELLTEFLVIKIGLPIEKAVLALRDFRIMRQGSAGTVYPS